jgi:hypothetical protein
MTNWIYVFILATWKFFSITEDFSTAKKRKNKAVFRNFETSVNLYEIFYVMKVVGKIRVGIFHIGSRHASFPIVPRVMKKARSWRSLESSIGVLRLRKCDKIRNFHRKQMCAHPICKTKSAIIKFQKYSSQKS